MDTVASGGFGYSRTRAQTKEKLTAIRNERTMELTFQRASVSHIDARRLEAAEHLNDTLIDFFFKLILDLFREEGEDELRVHAFSSLFYSRLKKSVESETAEPAKLIRWSKGADILKQDVIVLPINNDNQHWWLTLILNPSAALSECSAPEQRNARILYLDSLCGKDGYQTKHHVFQNMAVYLDAESKSSLSCDFEIENMEELTGLVPMQKNTCDCGIFILEYVIQILVRPAMLRRLGRDNLTDWFTQNLVTWRRSQLKECLLYIAAKTDETNLTADLLLKESFHRKRIKEFFLSKPPINKRKSFSEDTEVITIGLAKPDTNRLFVKIDCDQLEIDFDSEILALLVNVDDCADGPVQVKSKTFEIPNRYSMRDVVENHLQSNQILIIARCQEDSSSFSDDDAAALKTIGYPVDYKLGPKSI